MSGSLQELRNKLDAALNNRFLVFEREGNTWGDIRSMTVAREELQRRFDCPGQLPDTDKIADAVRTYRKTGRVHPPQLKYVCYGAAAQYDNIRLLSDEQLRSGLLSVVEEQREKIRLRCLEGLLHSYWSFPRHDERISSEAVRGWETLRDWLFRTTAHIYQEISPRPEWLNILNRNSQLLRLDACKLLGSALLSGDDIPFKEVTFGLAIPQDSWVAEETVISCIATAARDGDNEFNNFLPCLIAMLDGTRQIPISSRLRVRAAAMLISRYAQSDPHPEHVALRDLAIAEVGNPWLRKQNWDAHVRNDRNEPHEPARVMVDGWLKRRLIRDFFELLSDDRVGDPRRLNYWLRFEPLIEDMWFALGAQSRAASSPEFADFRRRAKGRLMHLGGVTQADNNAFIMRIGEFLIMEFGAPGNACTLQRFERLPKQVRDQLNNIGANNWIDVGTLRSAALERGIHRDTSSKVWETKFDEWLQSKLDRLPNDARRPQKRQTIDGRIQATRDRFSTESFLVLCAKHHVRTQDHRKRGGALWALGERFPAEFTFQLQAWGFRPRQPRGWWKDAD
jgi:hypothetical protein